MKILGIVCEYNPFHKGHLYQMEEAKKLVGSRCGVVCVMGGNFMQRGEPAVFSKHARAEAAVLCGADVVIELPLPWAISSAEGFARGAVGILGALGAVTHIAFGSECGDLDALSGIAEELFDPALNAEIRAELETGLPYAKARQNALEKKIGIGARLLEKPNNILAVEYIKAIYDQRLDLTPLTVARTGAGHDETGSGEIRSATELRATLELGGDISAHVPRTAMSVYLREMQQGRGPVTAKTLETATLSRLRMLSKQDFSALPDASEGLDERLYAAARSEPGLNAVLAAAKTKRYTMSRLRRMLMCAALGVKSGMAEGIPPYAKLLACSDQGREMLRDMAERSHVPVITKPAAVKAMGWEANRLFELESSATDFYVLGFSAAAERRGGREWRTSPVVVRE